LISCFPLSRATQILVSLQIALKVKEMKMANGQLLFTPKNIEILGGYVEALVSKWEVTRSLAGMKGGEKCAP
jgi:RecQ mediated genome instability protein